MNPFEHKTPSAFIISSPFQALCAVSAIHNLHIADYKIIAILNKSPRDKQLVNYLDKVGVEYEKEFYTKTRVVIKLIKCLIGVSGRYERLFIGNFHSYYMLFYGFLEVKFRGTNLVYLDDGTIVLVYLKDKFIDRTTFFNRKISEMIASIRGVKLLNNFYTVYSDVKNKKYNIGCNVLFFTSDNKIYNNESDNNDIYIIGTYTTSYCKQLFISIDLYLNKIKEVFEYVKSKHPNNRIIYIPHGSDRMNNLVTMCHEQGIEYRFLDTMIEDYIFRLSVKPSAIYGLSSTSLLNMKRMIPQMNIINILIYSNESTQYLTKYIEIADYYAKHGINTLELVLDNDSRVENKSHNSELKV